MTDARDKAAEEYVGHGYGCDGDTSRDSFKKGWDACAKQQFVDATKEAMKNGTGLLGQLSMENERLRAQVISWHAKHDAYFIQRSDELKKIMAAERDRWREQAEALAVALEYQLTAWRKICDGSMFTPESERAAAEKIANKALADFEAFKKRIKD